MIATSESYPAGFGILQSQPQLLVKTPGPHTPISSIHLMSGATLRLILLEAQLTGFGLMVR